MTSFQIFNKLWTNKTIDKPLLIFIGGYCGTGKSNFAKKLQTKIISSIIVYTGVLRATISPFQGNTKKLKCHTYQLYKFCNNDSDLLQNFYKQSESILKSTIEVCKFAQTEKQNIIFDGNHITPDFIKRIPYKNKIEIYFKTSNHSQLIKNMTGQNHPRNMIEQEIKTSIKLQDLLIQNAYDVNKIFEFNHQEKAAKYIEYEIQKILDQS